MKTACASATIILLFSAGISGGIEGARAFQNPNQIRILLGTLAKSGTSYDQILRRMGEKWQEVTGSAVRMTIYPGTQGGEKSLVQKMHAGSLNAGMLTVAGLSEIDKDVGGLSYLPLMFRSWEEHDYVLSKLAPRLEKRLLDKGFVTLFWGDAGWVYYFTRVPAVRPDEFKKLKIWVWSGDTFQVDLMKKLGYDPVPREIEDLLTNLKTSTINAFAQPAYFALGSQCYREAKNMLDLKWSILAGATVIKKTVWDKIAPDMQQNLRQAAAVAGQEMRQSSRREDAESIDAMKKNGLTVRTISPEIEDEWRQFARRIYPEIRGHMVPADIFDEIERLVAEFRASAKGTEK